MIQDLSIVVPFPCAGLAMIVLGLALSHQTTRSARRIDLLIDAENKAKAAFPVLKQEYGGDAGNPEATAQERHVVQAY